MHKADIWVGVGSVSFRGLCPVIVRGQSGVSQDHGQDEIAGIDVHEDRLVSIKQKLEYLLDW